MRELANIDFAVDGAGPHKGTPVKVRGAGERSNYRHQDHAPVPITIEAADESTTLTATVTFFGFLGSDVEAQDANAVYVPIDGGLLSASIGTLIEVEFDWIRVDVAITSGTCLVKAGV